MSKITSEISTRCSCPFVAEYIANAALTCGDSTTDRVIVEGSLVALPQISETSLHKLLQSWVDEGPKVEVLGSSLTVVQCSTYASDKRDCPLQNFAATDQSGATLKLETKQSDTSIFLYGGIGAGVVVVILLTCLVVALVWGVRRKKRHPFISNT